MKRNNVVLIGFMGSGKSTVGLRLSYRLRRCVEDTDKMIERREKISIKEIFATKGEEAFRQMETDLLKELGEKLNNHILAVGGGTPVREENRALLKELGTVIYLRAQADTVCKRLKNDTTRPLLQGENPRERVAELLEARKEAYESSADIIIDVDDLTMEEIVGKIEALVSK